MLCKAHAQDEGLLARSARNLASLEEMRFFDDVETNLIGGLIDHRIRLDGTEPVGRQKEGLVPGTKLRPDGYRERNEDGVSEVWLYHGDYFHGYPLDHPDHETEVANGKWGPDAYRETWEAMSKYQDAGHVVRYVWGSDYKKTLGPSPSKRLADVIKTLPAKNKDAMN